MVNTIRDPRVVVSSKDRVCASETLETGRNGYFDARLIRKDGGDYIMEIYMKVQFDWVDGDASKFASAADARWTEAEKKTFMTDWHTAVRGFWSGGSAGTLSNGRQVRVVLALEVQDGGFMWDHFEVEVTKIPSTDFKTSSVSHHVFGPDVRLDSNDLAPKPSGQIAAVHEFGHMLGLPDEYHSTSAHSADNGSIMHGGTTARPRHFAEFLKWAEKKKC